MQETTINPNNNFSTNLAIVKAFKDGYYFVRHGVGNSLIFMQPNNNFCDVVLNINATSPLTSNYITSLAPWN